LLDYSYCVQLTKQLQYDQFKAVCGCSCSLYSFSGNDYFRIVSVY